MELDHLFDIIKFKNNLIGPTKEYNMLHKLK
jgi:hypothetical protein